MLCSIAGGSEHILEVCRFVGIIDERSLKKLGLRWQMKGGAYFDLSTKCIYYLFKNKLTLCVCSELPEYVINEPK